MISHLVTFTVVEMQILKSITAENKTKNQHHPYLISFYWFVSSSSNCSWLIFSHNDLLVFFFLFAVWFDDKIHVADHMCL